VEMRCVLCSYPSSFPRSLCSPSYAHSAIPHRQTGFFAFGGSTIVVVFKPNTVQFDSDLLTNSKHSVRLSLLHLVPHR
jgi:hypothetical protein